MSVVEISAPTGAPLTGKFEAQVVDSGPNPTNIIRADDNWGVKFDWELHGALTSCICGDWCLHIRMESIGPGPELALPDPNPEVRVPLDPCGDGKYSYMFNVAAGRVSAEHCGIPYHVVATLTYRTPCDKPGPIAAFCDLGLVEFYESSK